ncbi:19914_t:CDS:2, partial [Cetraspora pellucida]
MTPNLVNKDAILNGSFTNGYYELNGIHDDAEIFNGSFANGYNELDDSIHNDGEIPNESFINGHRESNGIQSNGQIFNELLTNGHNELNGQDPDPYTGAVIPPISLSTTFKQYSIGAYKGYEYSRSSNLQET